MALDERVLDERAGRSALFSFPNPVNDVSARTVATGVVVMAALVAGLGWGWVLVPLTYGFVARVCSPARRSPRSASSPCGSSHHGSLSTEKLVPGPPKRFAQGIGVAFTVTASALWLAGAPGAARIAIALLAVAATLEAAFGVCLGCKVFALLMRAGIVPESVCEECNDISLRLPGLRSPTA